MIHVPFERRFALPSEERLRDPDYMSIWGSYVDLSRSDAAPLIAFMQQKRRTMGTKRTDEFRADAVRVALTSGLTRRQVASDLGIGLSTLTKWVTAHRDKDVMPDKDLDLACENERLRRENRILREEREILKKATQFFAGQKP